MEEIFLTTMIKIPQDGKYSQPNNSDLFGNIWYTKSVNFDEEGYLKLSSRMVSLKSEQDDSSFDIPISFGRATTEFHVVTSDAPFDVTVSETSLDITEDTGSNNPSLSFDSWGRWFQNRWHASDNTKIWYTTGGAWTDTSVSLTTGKVHPMEVFVNKNSLAVGNGNTVLLLNTSYATTVTLTVPVEFEIVGLSYCNNQIGIITMLSDTVAGQNLEAYFFVWDGANTSAGAGFPVGTDNIFGICAYKSSWVILTRNGELLYFNGGGFDTLATLPMYYLPATWGDAQNRDTFGDIMSVDGEVIYINIGNDISQFGINGESYIPNNPAGVLCYDPKVGLYHRYAHSISPIYQIAVASANVNTTTDIITATSGTLPATGNPIRFVNDTADPIGGLDSDREYFIIKHTATDFSLAETKQDALDGNKVDLTTQENAVFHALNLLDYGTTIVGRSGGVGAVEVRRRTGDHLLVGTEVRDFNSSTLYSTLCLSVPRFSNIGYFVTAKIVSPEIEDLGQKMFIKYRPLNTNDTIVVKHKDRDVYGIPTSTPHALASSTCTWTDSNTFTTTADLSAIKNYLDAGTERECEVEIIAGAGAGQMSQISSITFDTGTYTVNLDDEIDGATATYTCDVLIDNWKKLGEVTSTDTQGWKEFPIASTSKWSKFKVELRGSETTIEELQIVNTPHITTQ